MKALKIFIISVIIILSVFMLIDSVNGLLRIRYETVETKNNLLPWMTIEAFFATMCLIGSTGMSFFKKRPRYQIITKLALNSTLAIFLSALSMMIQNGTDMSQSETIGAISRSGFPIYYRTYSSSFTWAEFDSMRFLLNSFVWFTILALIWITLVLIKKQIYPPKM